MALAKKTTGLDAKQKGQGLTLKQGLTLGMDGHGTRPLWETCCPSTPFLLMEDSESLVYLLYEVFSSANIIRAFRSLATLLRDYLTASGTLAWIWRGEPWGVRAEGSRR